MNEVVLTDEKKIADAFNEYFSNIGTTLNSNFSQASNYEQFLSEDNKPSTFFNFIPITMGDLEEVMKNLNSASPGHDELPMRLFKDNLDILGERILTICNASFIQGVFPAQLKRAKVVPIFKSGDRRDIRNYRPISILNSFNKILEKIAYLQLYYYLTSNNILTRRQYGFRTGYSTEKSNLNSSKCLGTLHIFKEIIESVRSFLCSKALVRLSSKS